MNIGYEDDELKPYIEPPKDVKDENRIAIIQQMGYSRNAIVVSLDKGSFDDLHATYILLGEKKREVKFLNRARCCSDDLKLENVRLSTLTQYYKYFL